MTWVEDVGAFLPPAGPGSRTSSHGRYRDALSATSLAGKRLGVFGAAMPLALAPPLDAAVTVDAAEVWEELVASPSDYDAKTIGRTTEVADRGLAAAVEAAAAGVTEYEVCLAALERMAAEGAEFLHGSGYSTHVNIGSFSDVVSNVRPYLFDTPPRGEAQMFWLDLSASCDGCYTDTDRTISVGEPTRPPSGSCTTSRPRCTRTLVDGARPGVPGGDLWETANRVAVAAGYGEHSNLVYLGHTTGITTSSRPVLAQGETATIVEGFLNVEPGIFVPGVGSACIENTLHITETGASPVNTFGMEIHVV